ncbi:MAG: DUF1573 domain-containing protein [Firmicutes bacterium]|nr:DUF1573 domain-containing protein [Bacillota bacterium]
MKKGLIIGSVICLILITIFFGFGKSLIGAPILDVPEDSWDFGAVKPMSVLKHSFIIKNTGNANLTLNVYPNCRRCIHTELEKTSIPPGGATKLNIELFVKGEGTYESYAMLESNDPKQRVKKLTAKAMVAKQ